MRVEQTPEFELWFLRLKDARARGQILARLRKIQLHESLFGDVKSVGGGVVELRFHTGPGYRIYAALRGHRLMILLAGGDKSSQDRDIRLARTLAEEWRTNDDHQDL
ncbi:type II toxin-antitoxin system RelE/ParE family toxin [Actinomyces sp.]|uniref:type II toxin-antitoxin system RelE/ParE family toxin n=1 Tax=Actinomyces sp. TaxID=29317 RepID=UPI0028A0FAE5|nr:type II toxin-antitoxin system RelE/ParE family toxin [Actinomyces sp.]